MPHGSKLSSSAVNPCWLCICLQTAYLELRRISSVKHVFTVEATKNFVTSLVLSHLDCVTLLSGMSQQVINNLERFKIVLPDSFLRPKCTHASPVLAKLQRHPIAGRIECLILKRLSFFYVLWTCLNCFTRTFHPIHCVLLSHNFWIQN